MTEEKVLHKAAYLAFSNCEAMEDVSFQKNEDHNAVTTAVNANGSLVNITVRIYHPLIFYRIRKKLKVHNEEIFDDLNHGDLHVSNKAGLYDEGNFYSDRERVMIHGRMSIVSTCH